MINKIILPLFIVMLFGLKGYTQGYTTAFGMRLGTEWGVTLNQVIYDKVSLEGIYQSGFFAPQYGITGLAKLHNSVIGRRFNFFFGAGVHKFWERGETVDFEAGSGITLIAGLDVSLGKFNLSYDFKPAINVFSGSKKFDSQTAVSLRYVIVKKTKWAKKKRQRKRAKRKKNRKKINWKFWEKD